MWQISDVIVYKLELSRPHTLCYLEGICASWTHACWWIKAMYLFLSLWWSWSFKHNYWWPIASWPSLVVGVGGGWWWLVVVGGPNNSQPLVWPKLSDHSCTSIDSIVFQTYPMAKTNLYQPSHVFQHTPEKNWFEVWLRISAHLSMYQS